MANDYLVHWGVKGMKWGVRRYQNKDGSLTPKGQKRYARDAREQGYKEYDSEKGTYYKVGGKKNKRTDLEVDANKYYKDDLNRSKRLVDESNRMTQELKRANDNAIKNKPRQQMDLSNMSDKEMREQINRKLLEKQYMDMFAPQTTSKGREYAGKILDGAGSALAITGSALGVALAIKELRG